MPPELHPLSQKYPPMDAEEFAAFKADLAENGQKNPIWLFAGKVLDGRNRLRGCLELGLDPVFTDFEGSESEAAAFVDSQNLHRRHLSREWRQQRVREMRSEGCSTREIAQSLGCHRRTVERILLSGGAHAPPESTPTAAVPANDGSVVIALAQAVSPRAADATPEPDRRPTQTSTGSPTIASNLAPEQVPNAAPSAPSQPSRIQGRDGKSYRAQRPTAPKPKPAPKEKAQWAELATVLSDLAQKIETLVPTPEENERPWELISSLEKTAASLLQQAQRLRRRHHL